MNKIIAQAPAKINLFLKVLNKRSDGYHNIQSVFQTVSLYDELEFEIIDDRIEVTCDAPINDKDNLVYKAAALLKNRYCPNSGIRIHLTKRIPLAAGLGGGSSDAACALIELNKLWDIKLSDEQLIPLAKELGADAPFFIRKGAALVEGIGEILTPWPILPCEVLLVKPQFSVSTAWAYQNLSGRDKIGLTLESNYINIFQIAWKKKDLATICDNMQNDFEEIIQTKYPLIEEIKQTLKSLGAQGSLMSGSGPTVFGLFNEKAAASAALTRLKQFFKGRGEVFLASAI